MAFFLDGFLRPVILHVILPCSLAGRWEESGCETYLLCFAKMAACIHVHGQQLFHPSVLPRHVDRRSSRLLLHNRASLISVREFMGGGGGGLTARRKRKSSLLRPPPLLPGNRSQKGGGHNSWAVRYTRKSSHFIVRLQVYFGLTIVYSITNYSTFAITLY